MPGDGKELRGAGTARAANRGERGKYINAMVTTAIIFLLGGCGPVLVADELVLAPQVSVTPINIGSGAKVYLTVLDERLQRSLADFTLGPFNYRHTDSASGDPGHLFQESLRMGLLNLGFEVLPSPEVSPVSLEIQLRSLQYYPLHDGKGGLEGYAFVAAAWAEIRRGETHVFQKRWESASNSKGFTRRWREEKINAAFSDLIAKILGDLELLTALK